MDSLKSEIILLNKDKLCGNIMEIVKLNKSVIGVLTRLSEKQEVHLNEFQNCITSCMQVFGKTDNILKMIEKNRDIDNEINKNDENPKPKFKTGVMSLDDFERESDLKNEL